jgi:hypothetical protein
MTARRIVLRIDTLLVGLLALFALALRWDLAIRSPLDVDCRP